MESDDQKFAPNQTVNRDSVFWILHLGHRKPHLAIVLKGQLLPSCSSCGANVRYVLAEQSSQQWGLNYIGEDPDFLQIERLS
jgi:hypothetical protein